MNALLIVYGGNLSKYAFEPLLKNDGKNSIALSLEQSQKFPGVKKTVLIAGEGDFSFLNNIQIEQKDSWTKRSVLEKIAELQTGYDLIYFAFADCPFLDPALAGSMAERHLKYSAEYSYADGYPYGLAPEILSSGTAGILAKILGEDSPVERDTLFSVIQKDINAFDIETEISPVDLSSNRINLTADSKRNNLLLNNFINANNGKIPCAEDVIRITENNSEILRTLPAFYPIQVFGGCPQACALCPYPSVSDVKTRKDFMNAEIFESLLDKIIAFSGDAVIDLSLWGELSLHPEKLKLIEAVIKRKELSLIIETSGIGWQTDDFEKCVSLCEQYKTLKRESPAPALSWIISLDSCDVKKYTELRGAGFAEAESCAKKLLSLFQDDCYVQAVRFKGSEEDTEKFYRYWKEYAPNGEKNIIIQKYDDFCGTLEKKQASDISPVVRQSCAHIMRDMPVLIDGTVPLCRENISVLNNYNSRETELSRSVILGNVLTDTLEKIWQNGDLYYKEQCKKNYGGTMFKGLCANCDEYYTFNF